MTAPRPDEDGLFDAKGRWVPARLIKEVDRTRHDLVLELFGLARAQEAELAAFKARIMGEVDAFMQLSAEKYGAQLGGTKGNVTLTSYDGRFKIVRAVADFLVFDERLQAAKVLVDDCIREWTRGSRDEIRALVEHAFQVDKAGKVSTERVLGLRKLEIDHEKWHEAMRAIGDSVQVASSKAYVRFYERVGDSDKYRPLSLDLSSAGER